MVRIGCGNSLRGKMNETVTEWSNPLTLQSKYPKCWSHRSRQLTTKTDLLHRSPRRKLGFPWQSKFKQTNLQRKYFKNSKTSTYMTYKTLHLIAIATENLKNMSGCRCKRLFRCFCGQIYQRHWGVKAKNPFETLWTWKNCFVGICAVVAMKLTKGKFSEPESSSSNLSVFTIASSIVVDRKIAKSEEKCSWIEMCAGIQWEIPKTPMKIFFVCCYSW